jgi:hypothetical protein
MLTTRRFLLALASVLVLLAPPRLARAQEPGAKERAAALFEEGSRLLSEKRFEDALGKFREARVLFQSFKIDHNMAMAYFALGQLPEAAASYELFLREGKGQAPSEIYQAAREKYLEIMNRLASVSIPIKEPGAIVVVDGKKEYKTPLETRIYLSPGPHEIVVTQAGALPFVGKVASAAGVHQVLAIPMRPVSTRLYAPPARGEPRPVVEERSRGWKTPVGYALTGVGGALVVTSIVLFGIGGAQGIPANDSYDRINVSDSEMRANPLSQDTQNKLRDLSSYHEEMDSARKKIIAAGVLVGVGAVVAGVGIWALVSRPAEAPANQGAAGLHFVGGPFPSGFTLGLAGSL